MSLARFAGAAVLAFSVLAPAAAAAPAWTPLGPPGGNVLALVADPSTPGTLYAGVYAGGVLKTTDAGASWQVASANMRGWSVHSLAIDPTNPRTLYAGTWDEGVWKSTDGGASWKRVFGEQRQAAILALAIDPKNPRNVYAATETGPNDGVHRSSDGGATWKRSTEGLPHNFRLYALAIDPQNPSTLYVTPGDGVFKSVDGGQTWKATGPEIASKGVRALAVAPSRTDMVYAGILNDGMYVSSNGGASWTAASSGRMKDAHVYSLLPDPGSQFKIWAGVSNDVMVTDDAGRKWADLTNGYNYMHFGPLLFDAAGARALWAGTSIHGVLHSSDGGKTWTGPGAGFLAADVTAIVTDASAPQTIWAATNANGVFKSADSGATWALKSEGLTDRGVNRLILDAASHTLYAGTDEGVFKSTDGAEHWVEARSGLGVMTTIKTLALDPSNPKTLYARDTFNVFRTSDGGGNWTQLKGDFETGGSTNGLFPTIVLPGETALVGFYRDIYRITDGGKTSTKIGKGLPLSRVQVIAADAAGKTLYAGTEGEGVWKSADGGATWAESGLARASAQALLIDPATPGKLYAACWKKGVFVSSDSAKTWARVGGEPPHPDTITLALDFSAPGRLLVGTSGGSIWRLDTTAVEKAAPAATPRKAPAKAAPKKK